MVSKFHIVSTPQGTRVSSIWMNVWSCDLDVSCWYGIRMNGWHSSVHEVEEPALLYLSSLLGHKRHGTRQNHVEYIKIY